MKTVRLLEIPERLTEAIKDAGPECHELGVNARVIQTQLVLEDLHAYDHNVRVGRGEASRCVPPAPFDMQGAFVRQQPS